MRCYNRIRLMYRMAARRIFITILLLSINIVSFYMVDMVGTSYFSDKYAIDGMANMFYENPECVNYIKVVGTSRTSAAAQTISDYVRTVDDIKYCGYFNDGAATDLIEGETVHVVISDIALMNMGKLKLTNEQKGLVNNLQDGHQPVLLGNNYKGKVEIGDVFTLSFTDENDCVVAGFLEKGAAWPKRGKLFGNGTNSDSYNLDDGGILLTKNYSDYDTSHITDSAYEFYYVVNEDENDKVRQKIIDYATANKISVGIVNVGEQIQREKENNNFTNDKVFFVTILLVLLSLLSMSISSVVYCLLNKKNCGVMIASGMKKSDIIMITTAYNAGLFVLSAFLSWIIRQYEIFGKLIPVKNMQVTELLYIKDVVAHMQSTPIMLVIMLVIMIMIVSVIPSVIISRMTPVEMLYDKE